MFYVALIAVCLILLAIFFGVTIAGGRAHDRQNAERDSKAGRPRTGEEDRPAG